MEALSSLQSRMAIDSILNPSGSVDSHPNDCRLRQTYYLTSPYRQQQHVTSYYPDQGLKQPYPHYPRPSHHHTDYSRPSFSFSSSSHGSSSLLPSTESSPSPFSQERYDSISSTSTSPTTASRASIFSSATSSSTDAFNINSHKSKSASTTPTISSHFQSHGHGPSRNTNTNSADRCRPARPKYEEEEMYFIWYHRVDLGLEWKEVRESFNRQFPSRPRSGFQGIQSKFYRFIREKKCPMLREQRRMRNGEFLHEGAAASASATGHSPTPEVRAKDAAGAEYGVVEWMGVCYPWMRENRLEVARRRIST